MSKEIAKKGAVAIIVPIAIAAAIAFITQYNIVDSKVENVRKESEKNNTAVVQRVSVLETEVPTLKQDVSEIKADVKELLKRTK